MPPAIKLISTDFDGTLYAEFENPPIPVALQKIIGDLQAQGAKWVINTGRDMTSLLLSMRVANLSVRPDYLVLVEREIHVREGIRYAGLDEWNNNCVKHHGELFERVQQDVSRLTEWVNQRFSATIYSDAYSPFCFIAGNNRDAEVIHDFLNEYCRSIPNLVVVRNDIYARFSHASYNKGTALTELARRLKVKPDEIFAAGDHLNDLPMLDSAHAKWLAAPANAVDAVKQIVKKQNGFVSELKYGHGVGDALRSLLYHSIS